MGKVLGLSLIAVMGGCGLLVRHTPERSARIALATVTTLLWISCSFVLFGVLVYEAADSGPSLTHCAVTNDDSVSVSAPSHWTWMPPGIVCDYPTGDVGASYWRVPAALALAVMPVAAAATWPRRRRKAGRRFAVTPTV